MEEAKERFKAVAPETQSEVLPVEFPETIIEGFAVGQTVFAKWTDGYYYPAVVDAVDANESNKANVTYLDGMKGTVPVAQLAATEDVFRTMQLEGQWKNAGMYFKGRLDPVDPMTMYYNDGDVEQVQLKQLRAVRPGEPVVWKQAAPAMVAAAVAAGLTVLVLRKVWKR